MVKALAWSIVSRQPPRLLVERSEFVDSSEETSLEALFLAHCRELPHLADEFGVPLGRFLICTLTPVGFEPYGFRMTAEQHEQENGEGKMSEMIRIFPDKDAVKPVSVVSIKHSILNQIGGHVHRIFRVYFVPFSEDSRDLIPDLKERIQKIWQSN